MDKKDYLELIHKKYPFLSWKRVKFIDDGCDNNVVILDNKHVFRFPKKKDTVKNMRLEVRVLGYLYPKVQIDIPKVNFVSYRPAFFSCQFINGSIYSQKDNKDNLI